MFSTLTGLIKIDYPIQVRGAEKNQSLGSRSTKKQGFVDLDAVPDQSQNLVKMLYSIVRRRPRLSGTIGDNQNHVEEVEKLAVTRPGVDGVCEVAVQRGAVLHAQVVVGQIADTWTAFDRGLYEPRPVSELFFFILFETTDNQKSHYN